MMPTSKRELLIVTYLGHQTQFLIQCKSINRFLRPCKITVVLNECGKDLEIITGWFNATCKRYFQNHELTVMTVYDFIPRPEDPYGWEGWTRQQVIKLLFGLICESKEYAILDSKNWFIRNTDVDEFYNSNRLETDHYENHYGSFVEFLRTKFFYKFMIRPISTPYIFKKRTIKKIVSSFGNNQLLINFFKNQEFYPPSEFILYDFFYQHYEQPNDLGKRQTFTYTIWPKEADQLDHLWFEKINDPEVKMIGIHKTVFEKSKELILGKLIKFVDFEKNESTHTKI